MRPSTLKTELAGLRKHCYWSAELHVINIIISSSSSIISNTVGAMNFGLLKNLVPSSVTVSGYRPPSLNPKIPQISHHTVRATKFNCQYEIWCLHSPASCELVIRAWFFRIFLGTDCFRKRKTRIRELSALQISECFLCDNYILNIKWLLTIHGVAFWRIRWCHWCKRYTIPDKI